jgi:FkbM family methyltransferase
MWAGGSIPGSSTTASISAARCRSFGRHAGAATRTSTSARTSAAIWSRPGATDAHQRFVGFEPDRRAFRILRWNLAANAIGFAQTFDVALANDVGTAPFYLATDPDASSLVRRESEGHREVAVQTQTLDAILGASVPDRIVLKIDVEGAEPRVLDGAARLLDRCSDIILVVEHHVENLARAGFDRHAVTTRLSSRGFRFWQIDAWSPHLSAFDAEADQFCDIVAARTPPGFADIGLPGSQPRGVIGCASPGV